MPRIRSVHPSLFTDEAFVSLSPLARIFLVGIWTECDDNGAFEWKPLSLKMRLLPGDNADAGELLAEIETVNAVKRYSVDGREYGVVRNFGRFQRPKKPKCIHPIPPQYRTYAASGASSSELDHDEEPPVPPKSEPVPQKGEIAPQMEDGGGSKSSEASASDGEPSQTRAVFTDSKHELWSEGAAILVSLGVSEKQARPIIGRWLRDVRDDSVRVLGAIQRARDARPADVIPWITRALDTSERTINGRQNSKGGIVDAGRRRLAQLAEFSERERELGVGGHAGESDIGNGTSNPNVRLLPARRSERP